VAAGLVVDEGGEGGGDDDDTFGDVAVGNVFAGEGLAADGDVDTSRS